MQSLPLSYGFLTRLEENERGVSRMTHIITGIITVIALALIGMASIAITLAVITMEEWDE